MCADNRSATLGLLTHAGKPTPTTFALVDGNDNVKPSSLLMHAMCATLDAERAQWREQQLQTECEHKIAEINTAADERCAAATDAIHRCARYAVTNAPMFVSHRLWAVLLLPNAPKWHDDGRLVLCVAGADQPTCAVELRQLTLSGDANGTLPWPWQATFVGHSHVHGLLIVGATPPSAQALAIHVPKKMKRVCIDTVDISAVDFVTGPAVSVAHAEAHTKIFGPLQKVKSYDSTGQYPPNALWRNQVGGTNFFSVTDALLAKDDPDMDSLKRALEDAKTFSDAIEEVRKMCVW